MSSSLEKLFTDESSKNFDKQIINIKTLKEKYNIEYDKEVPSKITKINGVELKTTTDEMPKKDDNIYDKNIKYFSELMKTSQVQTENLINIFYSNIHNDELFIKIYFLLNNIEILFLFDTHDYKLITRILNKDNFTNDDNYKKACFIAMVVFEMWSLTDQNGDDTENNSFYRKLINFEDVSGNYVDLKRYKRITELISEIKNDARDYVNSPAFTYDLQHNKIEIEIPKRNLDNIIKPIDEIK